MCLVAVVTVLSVSAFVTLSTRDLIISHNDAVTLEGVDAIVVLGCRVHSDGRVSAMLSDRLSVGVSLYHGGASDTMLMSGDHGTAEYDEVNAMRRVAMESGVPIERIFMDHAGFSTYDSMYRLKEVFGAKKVIIVTQRYHLYRSLYIARALGLDAVGVSASEREYAGQKVRDVREVLARNKDFLLSILKPLPKFLGEAIDLDGDGRITEG